MVCKLNIMSKLVMLILAIAGFMLFVAGCKKTETISSVPSIKFIAISPNPAIKYQDEIVIAIECTDGDGDLGENTPDTKNLFITDSRNNVTTAMRLSQLAPDNSSIILRVPINIHLLPPGFIDDNSTSESVSYSVYVKDRAGNQSNTIQTSSITVNQ